MAEIPEIKILCGSAENDRRLGDILRERGFSRKSLTRLKRTAGGILCSGRPVRTVDKVYSGDVITLRENDNDSAQPNPDLEISILFEDEHLAIFDKPPLMPCHESIKHRGDTLSNFFAAHCPGLTFRCINRLDRDTSGCVVVAKNRFCANAVQKSCRKIYYGICKDLHTGGGRICAPIARERESIIKRCVREDGQYAATTFCVTRRFGEYALCKFILETGRTHQVRCHMAYLGSPLVGDDMYGEGSELISRQALHCGEVRFIHPVTHEKLTISAPLPDDMKRIMGG
ncbi:MAG: RluA family pseudouridine synthase [Ruminococcus sp.]|nr:RluA family pseudouridine synthase [Ruminococcus sp.]